MPNREAPRLFHFSEAHDIATFVPRPVRVPSVRPAGQEWLNGPLVWAIDAAHAFMYLFPRECPRLLAWARPHSDPADIARWLGAARVIAYVESTWLAPIQQASLARYELASSHFEDLDDAGMWVSRRPASIIDTSIIRDLPAAIAETGMELRVVEGLASCRALMDSSLHVSGIRLRNSPSWMAPGPS